MNQAPIQHQHARTRVPVRLPAALALPLLGVVLLTIFAVGPALLAPKIRAWFPKPTYYVVSAGFAFGSFVAAMIIGGPVLVATDADWYRAGVLDQAGLVVAPLLLAWCASAFAWIELGWVGSLASVFFAALWGLKLFYAPTPDGTDFWPNMNCMIYGPAIALVVIAPLLAWFGRRTSAPQPAGAPAMPYPQPYAPPAPYGGYGGNPPPQR